MYFVLRVDICLTDLHFSRLLSLFKKLLLLFNYSCVHFLPIPPPHPSVDLFLYLSWWQNLSYLIVTLNKNLRVLTSFSLDNPDA